MGSLLKRTHNQRQVFKGREEKYWFSTPFRLLHLIQFSIEHEYRNSPNSTSAWIKFIRLWAIGIEFISQIDFRIVLLKFHLPLPRIFLPFRRILSASKAAESIIDLEGKVFMFHHNMIWNKYLFFHFSFSLTSPFFTFFFFFFSFCWELFLLSYRNIAHRTICTVGVVFYGFRIKIYPFFPSTNVFVPKGEKIIFIME